MKQKLLNMLNNVKRAVNKKTLPIIAGIGLSLIPLTANADELYLKATRKYYDNLGPYNAKIQEVSLGNVYGNLNGLGLGYSKSLNDKLDANLEANINYQRLDAIKEVSGVREIYGSNSKLEASIEPGLKYNIPITKSKNFPTSIQAGISVPINFVYMKSTNEDTSDTSLTPLVEIKPSIALKQNIGSWFLSLGASISKALTTSNNLDLSATQIFITAGKNFGEKEE